MSTPAQPMFAIFPHVVPKPIASLASRAGAAATGTLGRETLGGIAEHQ
jgi:hypothetical protein